MPALEGKVAIVTGSAVGIGRAIAVALGREGAKVVVNYSRSAAEAEETANLVRAAGGEAIIIRANVADDAAVKALVSQTLDKFGRIDILVNNAGITRHIPFQDLDALDDEVWDHLYDVNVKGAFFCSRAVVEPMRRQGEGRIINIASVAGIRPQGSSIAYCTSKAALIHMSRCLARTLGPEIKVNIVAPGMIDETRWNEGRPNMDEVRRSTAEAVPLKRVGFPDDIADAVLYLATRGNFMTGAVMVVDGGRELG